MNKQIIEHHGKTYDAITGRVISDIVPPKHASPLTKKAAPVRKTTRRTPIILNSAKSRTPQPAQTLMRHAVKKPIPGIKKQLNVRHEVTHASSQVLAVTKKHTVNKSRLERAGKIPKDKAVNRFYAPSFIPTTYDKTPVQDPPAPTQKPAPQVPPPVTTEQYANMFEKAVAGATHYVDIAAEKARFKKRARRHVIAMSSGALALLLLAGLVAYLNTPKLQMQVAGAVAGVSTHAPDFRAAGFTYDGVYSQDSKVIYGFKQGMAQYQLIEQSSNWSGEQMIDQISSVMPDGSPNYTILSVDNQTVYKFNSQYATWIKNGTWYQVYGDNPMTDQQLLTLARSS